jgi:hypothetical protein
MLLQAIALAGALSPSRAEAAATTTAPATIVWRGISWNVKSGAGKNPGHNSWSPANAFVDSDGDLHLAITNVDGTWTCAEVWTDATFGFGTYAWQVKTAVDDLDPNVVLGLFVYGPTALGPDGTHEIDIEYARFGSATADNGRWTIFPNVIVDPPLLGRSSYRLLPDADPRTTSRLTWSPTNVAFETLGGYQPAGATTNVTHAWTYQPADPSTAISQAPMPVHMNLWLFRGNPPADGQSVEVVIHDFTFTPAAGVPVPALPGSRAGLLAALLLGVGWLSLRRFGSALAERR